MRSRFILVSFFAAAMAISASTWAAGAADKDNYERILAILLTGNADNKKTAKEALRGMGDVGLELLKADADKPDSPRGAVAWAVLRQFLSQVDSDAPRELEIKNVETLRDFARRNIETLAKDWNAAYKARTDRDRLARQKDIVSDYIDILSASDKPKDFELLLKVLKYSLIVSENKLDWAGEFDVWARIWRLLSDRVVAGESIKDLQAWQATVDDHFRRYSLMKNYATVKAIQAYHTATLQIMQRIEAVKKKPGTPEGAGG